VRVSVLFLTAVSACWAQGPNLSRVVVAGRNGESVIQLRNAHTVAARAWYIARPDGGGWSLSDNLKGPGLPPGAVIDTNAGVEDELGWAVIYDDGTTAGDPKLLEILLANRRESLKVIPKLRQWIADVLGGRATLQSVKEKVAAMAAAPPSGGPAPASMAVLRVRNRIQRVEKLDEVGPELLEDLDGLRQTLEQSKPTLR
jgi:hypothetical protein